MPRFAANLSFLWTDRPFMARFDAAARAGFRAVEYMFPYDEDLDAIAGELRRLKLRQALFNLPAGDWAAGERGMACHPGREAEFAAALEQAIAYALATRCRRLHAMAGLRPADHDPAQLRATYVANLRHAAARLAPLNIQLLIEPINLRDMPGYYLSHQQQAHELLAEVGAPNLKVQMDFYHCQIMEGDLTRRLEQHLAGIGHIQIAGVPDRHEPDHGEVNYPHLFRRLDALGYEGFVGCEYRPRAGTRAGLGWLRQWRESLVLPPT